MDLSKVFSDYLHPHLYAALQCGDHPAFPSLKILSTPETNKGERLSAVSSSSSEVSVFDVKAIHVFQLALEEVLWVTLVAGSTRKRAVSPADMSATSHPHSNEERKTQLTAANGGENETAARTKGEEETPKNETGMATEEGTRTVQVRSFSSCFSFSSIPRQAPFAEFIGYLKDWWRDVAGEGGASPSPSLASPSHPVETHDVLREMGALFVKLASAMLFYTSRHRYQVEHSIKEPVRGQKNEEEAPKATIKSSASPSGSSSSKGLPLGVKAVATSIATAIFALRHRCKRQGSAPKEGHSPSPKTTEGHPSSTEEMTSYLQLLWNYFLFLFTQQLLSVFSAVENEAWQAFCAECSAEWEILQKKGKSGAGGSSSRGGPKASLFDSKMVISSAFSDEEEDEEEKEEEEIENQDEEWPPGTSRFSLQAFFSPSTTPEPTTGASAAADTSSHRLDSFLRSLTGLAGVPSSSSLSPPLVSTAGTQLLWLSTAQKEGLHAWGKDVTPKFFTTVFEKCRSRRAQLLSRSAIPHHVLQAPSVTGALVVVLEGYAAAWDRLMARLPPGALSGSGLRREYFPGFEAEGEKRLTVHPLGEEWKKWVFRISSSSARETPSPSRRPEVSSVSEVLQQLSHLPAFYSRQVAILCGDGSIHMFLLVSILASVIRARYSRLSGSSSSSSSCASFYRGDMDDVEYQWRCFCPFGLLFLPTTNSSSMTSGSSFPIREFCVPHLFHLITASHTMAETASPSKSPASPPLRSTSVSRPAPPPVIPNVAKEVPHPLATREARQELALLCVSCSLLTVPQALLLYHCAIDSAWSLSTASATPSHASKETTATMQTNTTQSRSAATTESVTTSEAGGTMGEWDPLSPTAALAHYTHLMNVAVHAAETQLNTDALLQDGRGAKGSNPTSSTGGGGATMGSTYGYGKAGGSSSPTAQRSCHRALAPLLEEEERGMVEMKEETALLLSEQRSSEGTRTYHEMVFPIPIPSARQYLVSAAMPVPTPTTTAVGKGSVTKPTPPFMSSSSPSSLSSSVGIPGKVIASPVSVFQRAGSGVAERPHSSSNSSSSPIASEKEMDLQPQKKDEGMNAITRGRLSPVWFILDLLACGLVGLATEAVIYLQHHLSLSLPLPLPPSPLLHAGGATSTDQDKAIQQSLWRYAMPSGVKSEKENEEGKQSGPKGSAPGAATSGIESSKMGSSTGIGNKSDGDHSGEVALAPVNLFLVPRSLTASAGDGIPVRWAFPSSSTQSCSPCSSSLSSSSRTHLPSTIVYALDQYLSYWEREETLLFLSSSSARPTTCIPGETTSTAAGATMKREDEERKKKDESVTERVHSPCLQCWWERTGRRAVAVLHQYLILLSQANCTLASEGFLCRLVDHLKHLCHRAMCLSSVPNRTPMEPNSSFTTKVEAMSSTVPEATPGEVSSAAVHSHSSALSLEEARSVLRHVFALSEWIVLHVLMPCLRVLPPSPILYDRLEGLFAVWEKASMQGEEMALYGEEEDDDDEDEDEEAGKAVRRRPHKLPRTPGVPLLYLHIRAWMQHEDFSRVKLVGEPATCVLRKGTLTSSSATGSYEDPSTTMGSSSSGVQPPTASHHHPHEEEVHFFSRRVLFHRRHPHEVLVAKDHQALLQQCLRRVNLENILSYRRLLTPVFYSEPLFVAEKLLQQAVGYRNDFLEVHRRLLMNGGAPPVLLTVLLHRGLHQLAEFAAEEQSVVKDLSRTAQVARFLAVITRACFPTPVARHGGLRLLLRAVEHALRRYARDAHVFALELLKAICYEFLGVGLAHEEQYREEQRIALGAVPARPWNTGSALSSASLGTTSSFLSVTTEAKGGKEVERSDARRERRSIRTEEHKKREEKEKEKEVIGHFSVTAFFGSGRGESFRRTRWKPDLGAADSHTPLEWYEARQCMLHILQEPCPVPMAAAEEEDDDDDDEEGASHVENHVPPGMYDVWEAEEKEIGEVPCRGGSGVDAKKRHNAVLEMTLGQQLLLHLCQRQATLHTLQADLEGPMEAVLLTNAKEQDTIMDLIILLDHLLLEASCFVSSSSLSTTTSLSSSSSEALCGVPAMDPSRMGGPPTRELEHFAIPLLALRLQQEAAFQRAGLTPPPILRLPYGAEMRVEKVEDEEAAARNQTTTRRVTAATVVDLLQEQLSYFTMAHVVYSSTPYIEALSELDEYKKHWATRYPIAAQTAMGRKETYEGLKQEFPLMINCLPLLESGEMKEEKVNPHQGLLSTPSFSSSSSQVLSLLQGVEYTFPEALARHLSSLPHVATSNAFREKIFIDWCRSKVLAEHLAHRQLYAESEAARKHLWSLVQSLWEGAASASSLEASGILSLATDVLVPRVLWSMEDTLFIENLLRWWWKESFLTPASHPTERIGEEKKTDAVPTKGTESITVAQHAMVTLTFTMVTAFLTFFIGVSSSEARRIGYFFATVIDLLHRYAWKEAQEETPTREVATTLHSKKEALGTAASARWRSGDRRAEKPNETTPARPLHSSLPPTSSSSTSTSSSSTTTTTKGGDSGDTLMSLLHYLDAQPKHVVALLRQSELHAIASTSPPPVVNGGRRPSWDSHQLTATTMSSSGLPIPPSGNTLAAWTTTFHIPPPTAFPSCSIRPAAGSSFSAEGVPPTTTSVSQPSFAGKTPCTTFTPGGKRPASTGIPPSPSLAHRTGMTSHAYPLQCHVYLTAGLVQLLSSPQSPPHVQRNALLVLERLPLEYHFPASLVCMEWLLRALRPFMVKENRNAPSATAAVKRLMKNLETRKHRARAAEGLVLNAMLKEAEVALFGKKTTTPITREGKEALDTRSSPPSITWIQTWLEDIHESEAYAQEMLHLLDPLQSQKGEVEQDAQKEEEIELEEEEESEKEWKHETESEAGQLDSISKGSISREEPSPGEEPEKRDEDGLSSISSSSSSFSSQESELSSEDRSPQDPKDPSSISPSSFVSPTSATEELEEENEVEEEEASRRDAENLSTSAEEPAGQEDGKRTVKRQREEEKQNESPKPKKRRLTVKKVTKTENT